MTAITIDDLRRRLPDPDAEAASDDYYLTLAQYVDKLWGSMRVFPELEESMRKRTVLDLVAYYQDIVADAGIWRSFSAMCRRLYGRPVPFYDEPDDYVDAELNLIDVQFVVWYSLESQLGFMGLVSPADSDLLRLARQVHRLFDFLYEDAPAAEAFKPLQELDLDDRDQVRSIFKTAGWLFWNSYFLRPVSKHAYEPDIDEAEELTVEETLTDERRLRTTFEQPTGPLALLVDEWLHLIVDGKPPRQTKQQPVPDHKYYRAMRKATGGEPIAFCATYEELEEFAADKLGWGRNPDGHFPQMKPFGNFVLLADQRKGLLVARDVAQYVAHPANKAYDPTAAAAGAHRIVMEPAACPIDLAKYLFTNNLVPDARYPAGGDRKLLHDNWDFLARMYLRNHYRGD